MGTLIPTTSPFLYLLAQQCRINWLLLSFLTMASVCVCVPNWKNVLGVSAVIRCVWRFANWENVLYHKMCMCMAFC